MKQKIALLLVAVAAICFSCTPPASIFDEAGTTSLDAGLDTVSSPSKSDAPSAASDARSARDGLFQRAKNPVAKPIVNPDWYSDGSRAAKKIGAGLNSPPPAYQASWSVPAWYVDPQGLIAGASDSNNCTTAITPCKTFAQIAARWGTYAPRLRQDTKVVFLSSHTDNTDPVYWYPYMENGSTASLQGAPLGSVGAPAVITGTLASVVAKNRTTGQRLTASLTGTGGGTVAIGQIIHNTTRASKAWTHQNTAGSTWVISQPIAVLTAPPETNAYTSVDTWANTDAFVIYQPTKVNILAFVPQFVDFGLTYTNTGAIWNLKGLDVPFDGNGDPMTLGGYVFVYESQLDRGIIFRELYASLFVNTMLTDGVQGPCQIAGARYGSTAPNVNVTVVAGVAYGVGVECAHYDQDIYLGYPGNATHSGLRFGSVGTMQLETGHVFEVGDVDFGSTTYGTGNVVWGAGTINVVGAGRAAYTPGAGGAVANFKNAGGLKINHGTTACSVGTGAAAAWNCGITINPANLDAAVGVAGFGSVAVNPGGGSFVGGTL